MPENASELFGWLSKQWVEHLAQAIEAMCSERPAFSAQSQTLTAEQIADAGGMLWWRQDFNIAAEARCWIGANTSSWQMIGGQVMKAAGIEDAEGDDLRNTYLEILNQSLSGLAQSLSAHAGREVLGAAGSQTAPESTEFHAQDVSFILGQVECSLLVVFSGELAEALEKQPDLPNPSTDTSGEAVRSPQPAPSGSSKSMELLLDVELPVSVSFGRAQLPLKDVLKLTTGSIIELNRAVSEPVEVIVNNCVIARGEVVVVEGNFGVRIRQVISRQERIRTLK